jgi:hypothetical protein
MVEIPITKTRKARTTKKGKRAMGRHYATMIGEMQKPPGEENSLILILPFSCFHSFALS